MNRIFQILLRTLPLLLLAIVTLSCGRFSAKKRLKGSASPETVVRYGSLALSARASGSIVWANLTPVRAPMSGRIDEITITENQTVQSGQCAAVMSSQQRAVLMDHAKLNSPEELDKWKAVYDPIPILTPTSGTVTELSVTAGQSIVPDQTLFVLGDIRIARMFVEETEISMIAPGSKATITIFAMQGTVLTGTVLSIGTQSTAYRNAVAYEVDIAVDEWPSTAKTGMSLNAIFSGPHREQVLLVPCTAVVSHAGKDCVCIADQDDTFSFASVKTGLADGVDVEILEGVEEGNRILIDASVPASLQTAEKSPGSPLLPFTNRP
jgi:multidrug efflux pump subunit AcrA (membrane-fusion protein)